MSSERGRAYQESRVQQSAEFAAFRVISEASSVHQQSHYAWIAAGWGREHITLSVWFFISKT